MIIFDKPGPQNTDQCLEIASQRAKELGIKEIVVATNKGTTALKALEAFQGCRIIAVNHHAGWDQPFQVEMPQEAIGRLRNQGAGVVIAAHALSGIERSFRTKHQGLYPLELVAETLRIFGQGTKVCVEIALMAADAGELSGNPVLCIGGSGSGADTAIVLTPAHQRDFLKMRIHEIICKPHL